MYLLFTLTDSAGNVSFAATSTFRPMNSSPRMFCSPPWGNSSISMVLVPNQLQFPGFCQGISAGNAFEKDSQEVHVFVSPITGQRIISHVSLSLSGTLSLGLIPFSLGLIELNFNERVFQQFIALFSVFQYALYTKQGWRTVCNAGCNSQLYTGSRFFPNPQRRKEGVVESLLPSVIPMGCANITGSQVSAEKITKQILWSNPFFVFLTSHQNE